MAENNMRIETGPISNVPKIEFINSSNFTGQDIERMRDTQVPGGGNQLEHLGEKSQYPRISAPTIIEYINQTSFTQSDIERMRETKVPGGGSQLEHLGESSPLPRSRGTFRNIIDRWFRRSMQAETDPLMITKTINKASSMVEQYDAAEFAGDKISQSALIKSASDLIAKNERIPVPVKSNRSR